MGFFVLMLEFSDLILFSLLALVAEILGTIGGFGSSLFFVPIAGMFLDFHSVLGITAIFHLSSNITKIALFREGINKDLLLKIGIPAILFVVLGAWLSKFFDTEDLKFSLAIFLISISGLLLLFRNLVVSPTLFNSIFGGSLSGMIAGLLGTGGAIRGITMAAFDLPKSVFIATSAVIDLGIDLSRSGVYFLNGYVHSHDLYLLIPLFVVSILGTLIGKRILNKMSQDQFKSLVLFLIFGIGIYTLIQGIF